MHFEKFDAALILALHQSMDKNNSDTIDVLVRLSKPIQSGHEAEFQNYGLRGVAAGRTIFTAHLAICAIAILAEQPWVRSISLSQKLTSH